MKHAVISISKILSIHATHEEARAAANQLGVDRVRSVPDDAEPGMRWVDHWFEPVVELRRKRKREAQRYVASLRAKAKPVSRDGL
jgi:hypothetical protein